jgi:hypothetical protein
MVNAEQVAAAQAVWSNRLLIGGFTLTVLGSAAALGSTILSNRAGDYQRRRADTAIADAARVGKEAGVRAAIAEQKAAELNKEAAELRTRAAGLELRAAELAKQVQLAQAAVSGRIIDAAQKAEMLRLLAGHKATIVIEAARDDVEGNHFALQLQMVFAQAGFDVRALLAAPNAHGSATGGSLMMYAPGGVAIMNAKTDPVSLALQATGQSVGWSRGSVLRDPNIEPDEYEVFVMAKAAPQLTNQYPFFMQPDHHQK